MITRLFAGILSAAFALLLTPCIAAPLAPVAAVTTASATYTISNHYHLVTVRSGNGRLLLTRRISTPTVRAVFAKGAAASPAKPHALSFSVEDGNGLRLWSAQVPVVSGMHSIKVAFKKIDNAQGGIQCALNFSSKSQPDATKGSVSHDPSDPPIFVCVIGDDNTLVSMSGGNKKDQFKLAAILNGATLSDSDGTSATLHMTSTGGTMEMNGTKIKIEPVKRDGKDYYSFPWNGHQVFVEGGCTISLTSDGDLTVNAPAATTRK